MTVNICLDGPSGAGKSTVAKTVAKKLGILYLDTGATFRALAVKAMRENLDMTNDEELNAFLNNTSVSLKFDDEKKSMTVLLDNEDVTGLIRENGVSLVASAISAYPKTREKLMKDWRAIAKNNDVIMDGRDIGTVVLPTAKYKFYLTADSRERARRRFEELKAKGEIVDIDVLQKQIEERDHNDSTRKTAPLKKADDAVLIDSTNISAEEVADIIIRAVEKGGDR